MAEFDILARYTIKASKAVEIYLATRDEDDALDLAIAAHAIPALSHIDVSDVSIDAVDYESQLEFNEATETWSGRLIARIHAESVYTVECAETEDAVEHVVDKLTRDELYFQEFLAADTEGWAFGDGFLTDTEVVGIRTQEASPNGM